MLVVKTFLAISKIPNAKVGLFAGEDIKAGQDVAISTPETHDIFTEEEYENAGEHFRNFLTEYSCHKDGVWILEKDNEKFINHSRRPNLTPDGQALKDIKTGEELLYDYRQIDDIIEQNPPDWL